MSSSQPTYSQMKHLKTEFPEEHVLLLTLNNSAQHNAITPEMIEDIENVLYAADKDKKIRTVVLTGEGKSFCAGGDVKAMDRQTGMFSGDSDELRRRYQNGIQRIPTAIEKFEKPLLAAVNGAAIGAGLDLACMCDLRMASQQAKFGETFVKLGLISGDGGSFLLQRVVGYTKALELTLTAQILGAEEALSIGLVNSIHPPESLLKETIEKAKLISKNSPLAIRHSKKLMRQAYHQTLPQHLQDAAFVQGFVQRSADHKEGVKALLEKRPANFEE